MINPKENEETSIVRLNTDTLQCQEIYTSKYKIINLAMLEN
jgi:hypothetical protein